MAFARTEIKELEPMVKSGKKRFVRYQEGAELYSMGLHTFEQLAKEAGAIYKIRRVVLVNLDIFDEYLDTFRMLEFCTSGAPPEVLHKTLLPVLVILGRLEYNEHSNIC